jgi:hypothetical protein
MYSIDMPEIAMAELVDAWSAGLPWLSAEVEVGLLDLQRRLEQDPASQGESRGGRERIVFAGGVAATFEVDPQRRLVRILRAWPFRRPR